MPDVYLGCCVSRSAAVLLQLSMTSLVSTTIMYQCMPPLIDTPQNLWCASAAVTFIAAATSSVVHTDYGSQYPLLVYSPQRLVLAIDVLKWDSWAVLPSVYM